jgi:hypothetical protein
MDIHVAIFPDGTTTLEKKTFDIHRPVQVFMGSDGTSWIKCADERILVECEQFPPPHTVVIWTDDIRKHSIRLDNEPVSGIRIAGDAFSPVEEGLAHTFSLIPEDDRVSCDGEPGSGVRIIGDMFQSEKGRGVSPEIF